MMEQKLSQILEGHAEDVAPRLLGCTLTRTIDGEMVRVKIAETESYHQSDAASHSFNGITPRTEVMFGKAGRLYVYFTYGMHYCCNIVTGKRGEGSAVLIRAVEPLNGETILSKNRSDRTGVEISNGPAKLCQALKIDKNLNGHHLSDEPLVLTLSPPVPEKHIIRAPRIGITREKEKLWRFYIKDNPFVSKK